MRRIQSSFHAPFHPMRTHANLRHRALMEEKPNEPAFPENETVCYDNVSAMDMTSARNLAVTIAIKLQCALGANGFGADRQLVVGRIFDMLQRQSFSVDDCPALAYIVQKLPDILHAIQPVVSDAQRK